MDLKDIDICAQTLDASIDGVEDMLARQSGAIDKWTVVGSRGRNGREVALVVDAEEALGENDHAVARNVVLLQGLSNNFLGFTVGVDIGLVEDLSMGG